MISKDEIAALVRGMSTTVKDFVAWSVAPLAARQDEIEKRLDGIPAGPKGEPGDKGADAVAPDPQVIAELLSHQVKTLAETQIKSLFAEAAPTLKGADGEPGKHGDKGPSGESIKGEPGAPGKDADPVDTVALAATVLDQLAPIAKQQIDDAVAALPLAKDGKNGADATPVDVDALAASVTAVVETRAAAKIDSMFQALPAPKDGANGNDGLPGAQGAPGKDVDPAVVDELRALAASVQAALVNTQEALIERGDALIQQGVAIDALHTKLAELPTPKDGAPGVQGIAGEQGLPGKDGTGIKGERGESGKDAYEMACERGYKGTQSEWLGSLHGADGQDAFGTKFIRGIDESRSYPKGTYALYKHKLIQAARATSNIVGDDLKAAGWDVMIGEPALVVERSDDFRTFTFKHIYADGETVEHSFEMPVVIDRGAYAQGKEYAAGDSITWGGSTFIATRATKDAPKGSDDWRLSCKRGNDGKDWDDPTRKTSGTAVRI